MSLEWKSILVEGVLTAVAHPFTYVQILIQLGYEPMKPELKQTFFLEKELQYPNRFRYMKHIRNVDGFFGLYRGLVPTVCANTASIITYKFLAERLGLEDDDSDDDCIYEDKFALLRHTCCETICQCSAVVVSQPFHVISIRCMAQFVGRENLYDFLPRAVSQISSNEGLGGFFKGLGPRIAYKILTLWLSTFFAECLNTFVLNKSAELQAMRPYSDVIMTYIAQQISDPLAVTSTIMVTKGSKLIVEGPPYSFECNGLRDCLRKVEETNSSKRGANFFFRKVNNVLLETLKLKLVGSKTTKSEKKA